MKGSGILDAAVVCGMGCQDITGNCRRRCSKETPTSAPRRYILKGVAWKDCRRAPRACRLSERDEKVSPRSFELRAYMKTSIPLNSSTYRRDLHGLENINVECFTPVINPNEVLQNVYPSNEFRTIIKRLGMPNVRKEFFGESYPVSGQELNPTFRDLRLFVGLLSLLVFERPIESLCLTGDEANAKACVRPSIPGGLERFVIQVFSMWYRSTIISDAR